MTVRGPATTGTPIQVRIPDDDLARVDAIADRAEVSRAELIRQYVRDGLALDERKAARRVGK